MDLGGEIAGKQTIDQFEASDQNRFHDSSVIAHGKQNLWGRVESIRAFRGGRRVRVATRQVAALNGYSP